MPHVRAGAASIHDPARWRAEDRVLCGEHAWAILSGTVNVVDGKNEADAAASIAEELIGSAAPPSLDAMEECLLAMDRAVAAWARKRGAGDDDLWGHGLGAILLVISAGTAHIAHVGNSRAYRLLQSGPADPLVAEMLTNDHSLAELARRRSDRAAGAAAGASHDDVVLSVLGIGGVDRIDFTRVAAGRGSRLVLVSPGARRALDTPLGYLRELRAPSELAQRICAEGRSRAGERAHHASAIVIDVDVDSLTGPYR